MEAVNTNTEGAPVRTTRGRSRIIKQERRSGHARVSGGPIQRYIIELVTDNPDMPYKEVAEEVQRQFDYARTSEKSVASTIYRAGLA